jgi:hypothetical protein
MAIDKVGLAIVQARQAKTTAIHTAARAARKAAHAAKYPARVKK